MQRIFNFILKSFRLQIGLHHIKNIQIEYDVYHYAVWVVSVYLKDWTQWVYHIKFSNTYISCNDVLQKIVFHDDVIK